LNTQVSLENRTKWSPAAFRVFISICETWKLTHDETATLLGVDHRRLKRWIEDSNCIVFPLNILERVSCVLGIYLELNTIFADIDQANDWIKQPNTAELFGGKSALDLAVSPDNENLLKIRHHLFAQTH
jgi:hypothetical protein